MRNDEPKSEPNQPLLPTSDNKAEPVPAEAPTPGVTAKSGDSMTDNQFKAMVVGTVTIIVCGFAMVPGWGFFGLLAGLERSVFYLVAAIVGAACGFFFGPPRLLGVVSGIILMVGSLFSLGLLLDNVEKVYKLMIVLAIIIGTVPGLVFFYVGSLIHRKLFGTLEPQHDEKVAAND